MLKLAARETGREASHYGPAGRTASCSGLTLVAVVGSGLSCGALFAFSSFVMRALAKLTGPEGIRSMQAINGQAPMPAFMTALLGTGISAPC